MYGDEDVSSRLLESIRGMPSAREVDHCGTRFETSPFDFYAQCPRCGLRIKLRGFGAVPTLEDVFDAVFEWIERNGAEDVVRRRREEIRRDLEDERTEVS